jgi:predicted DCC family thiol-disulfide oxidoreductase YuxK
VIKHDRANKFRFASLQSETAGNTLSEIYNHEQNTDSIVYCENEKIYQQSTAVLRILKKLGEGWQFFYVFIIVPPFIRDRAYTFIARNRYRWFGRNEECTIIPPGRNLL